MLQQGKDACGQCLEGSRLVLPLTPWAGAARSNGPPVPNYTRPANGGRVEDGAIFKRECAVPLRHDFPILAFGRGQNLGENVGDLLPEVFRTCFRAVLDISRY